MQTTKKTFLISSVLTYLFLIGHSGNHTDSLLPITDKPWQEVVISVTDLERTAQFFKNIGDYQFVFSKKEGLK